MNRKPLKGHLHEMMFRIFAFVVALIALTRSWPRKHVEIRRSQPDSVHGSKASFGGL